VVIVNIYRHSSDE